MIQLKYDSLDNVKRRVLEYLSVIKVKGDLKAPIICFVGPVSNIQIPSIYVYLYCVLIILYYAAWCRKNIPRKIHSICYAS